MTSRRRHGAWLISLTCALSACSWVDAPDDGEIFPPRPATIAVAEIPPCSMLTPDQQKTLGLRSPTPGRGTVNGQVTPVCTWLGSTGIDYNVQFIPLGAETAASSPGAVVGQINGFGSVQNVPAETFGGTPFCQVAIDAAAGQTIRVQARTRPGGPITGMDEQCRRANEAASMVMDTVVATAR